MTATETASRGTPPASGGVAVAAPAPISLAELSAVVALMTMLGKAEPAQVAAWGVIAALVPWLAGVTRNDIDDVWRAPAARVVDDMRANLPALVTEERFAACAAELGRLGALLTS